MDAELFENRMNRNNSYHIESEQGLDLFENHMNHDNIDSEQVDSNNSYHIESIQV